MSGNVLQWDGSPGHYEVYYLSATDPRSGLGLWLRYTMRAPLQGPPECALWFMAMDRDGSRWAVSSSIGRVSLRAKRAPSRSMAMNHSAHSGGPCSGARIV